MNEQQIQLVYDLDQTNIKILKILLSDARLSSRQIAKYTGVSIGTILSHVRQMEKDGVINGYCVMINHEKLGYELTAIIEITVSKGKLLEIEKEIAKSPNVCAVYDVTGLTDAMIITKFKSREELSNFVKNLLAMPNVERTNTHIALTTIKEDFRLI
jgi:DNA-binding Lrp family transcriptional regulator